jgi:hypothetical protein
LPSILLICDDENRRAELHQIFISEFDVYSTNHSAADTIIKKLGERTFIVIETRFTDETEDKEKISIYCSKGGKGNYFKEVIGKILKFIKKENF